MVQICSIWCIFKRSRSPMHILQIIQTLFRSSRHIFQMKQTLLGSSGNFPDFPDTFLFRVSRYIFQIIGKLFTSYGNFPVHPDTFQIIWKLSSSSGHWTSGHLDKISGNSSANNELNAKTFQIRKNFPVSIADALTGFF